MNCRVLVVVFAAAALLVGCKATNTNHPSTATRQPPSPIGTPPTLPPTPTPRTTPQATAAPRVGVTGQVVISASGFAPAEITVQTGHAITFVNADSVPHRVVSTQPGVFDTGDIAPAASASITIASSGFTDFHDQANPAHAGTIRTMP